MRIKPRSLVIATTLTAMTAMSGLIAAGTASASTLQAQASSSCSKVSDPSFEILNNKSGYYAIAPNARVGIATFFNDTDTTPTYFCPEDGTTIGGTTYYYYNDSNHQKCLTVDSNSDPQYTYEATCGEYPASQEWHYYYNGTEHDGTLENHDTGECLWFTGFPMPEKDLQPINVGDCIRNENNTIIEAGD